MSDNHANEPPVEMRLPDELARCESMLASMVLPNSQVQRDELMYRAGWAAADEDARSGSLRGEGERQSSRFANRRSTFAWSVASAAVAASLAVAITLRVQPAAVTPADTVVDTSRHAGPTINSGQQAPENLADPISRGFATPRRVGWTASLLIMRDRALHQRWDDPWVATENSFGELSSGDTGPSQPKTSREMMDEFLPGPSARDTSEPNSMRRGLRWPWNTIRLGETT